MEKKMDLASKVLQQIEQKKMKPKSKSVFLVHRAAIFASFVGAILLGAYTFSLLFFTLRSEAGQFQRGMGYMHVASDRLPILLILTSIVTIALGYYLFRKTRRGYRARSIWLILALVASIVAGGFIFEKTNAVFVGHRFMMMHCSPYRQSMERYREQMWYQPADGRLIGKIMQTDWDRFVLKSRDGREWIVDDVDAHWRNIQQRHAGDSIKVIGSLRPDSSFDADYILPWKGNLPGHRGIGSAPKFYVP